MEETKKTTVFHQFGGILFAILTLWQLFGVISLLTMYPAGTPIKTILLGRDKPIFWLIGLLIITVSLFTRKQVILIVGFGALTFIAIQSCFQSFAYQGSNGFSILINIIDSFGYLSAFLFSLATFSKSDSKYTALGKKIFFVPSVCITISSVIYILSQFNPEYRVALPVNLCWALGRSRSVIYYVIMPVIKNVICIVALLFASLWVVYPDVTERKTPATRVPRITTEPDAGGSNIYGNIQGSDSMEHANASKKFCSHCGKEIMAQAVICPHCGCAVAASPEVDIPSTGLNVLSFFIPLVGLILYCVHQNKAPKKARAIGKWALIGFGVGMLISILLYMVTFLLLL